MTNALFIAALIAVESGGNDMARGNHGEVGALQITRAVVADVNRKTGSCYRHSAMTNRAQAIAVLGAYLSIYATEKRIGRPVTDSDRARIWNGGPNGWRMRSTLPYLKRFRKAVE